MALIVGWVVLGVAAGVVALRSIDALSKGVRIVWPMSLVFAAIGYLVAGVNGMIVGMASASAIGLFVGR
ncbi:MAG: hypothetical protein IT546_12305 [Caulobacteraceae bacterium]|nr:hypothetical protein [Caulobacteraceae bacterium]